jgi:hypothetical protein
MIFPVSPFRLKIFAVLLWILGVGCIVALNLSGSVFGTLLQGGSNLYRRPS